ncbi:hypothetical protein [Hyphococcus luteus]|uniref:Uncharacterized protein n=1 Tax=Hyphococcus luteus TaxID=2058213 RepID=A0A2S7K0T5_9PROT|nr:hypothetical protein [Marinicaulis flavus]PQA86122.1 hypothetical protein CW354_17320 [Marinicaulis flavus]
MMNYTFKVIRRTEGYDEHTVTIDAPSRTEAKKLIENGEGVYESLDRDELDKIKITDIINAQPVE